MQLGCQPLKARKKSGCVSRWVSPTVVSYPEKHQSRLKYTTRSTGHAQGKKRVLDEGYGRTHTEGKENGKKSLSEKPENAGKENEPTNNMLKGGTLDAIQEGRAASCRYGERGRRAQSCQNRGRNFLVRGFSW